MTDVKGFFASKTIWGSAVAILATIAPLLGLNFGAADGAELTGIINQLIAIAGAIFAMYGRVVAKTTIG